MRKVIVLALLAVFAVACNFGLESEMRNEVARIDEERQALQVEVDELKALMAEPHDRLQVLETSDDALVNVVCALDAWARDLTGLFAWDVAEMQMEWDELSEEEREFLMEDTEVRGLFALMSYLDTPKVCEKANDEWTLVGE